MYAEVRQRILHSAGQVLAYGKDDRLLPSLTGQFADGGPIIFPMDDTACPALGTSIGGSDGVT